MYSYLPEVCKALRLEMMNVYWTLFPLLIICACILEIFKQMPDVKGVLMRSVISVLTLLLFPTIFDGLASIGDGLSEKIIGDTDIWKVLENLKDQTMELNFDWLNLKSGIIFVLNMLAYLISYIGFFFTNAIIHFIWAILYVLSPLMILGIVFRETQGITRSLFTNLAKVMSWKVLYSLLGVLLIKFIEVENLDFGDDNMVTTIVINLCVGISMLFIPLFANSLFGNALGNFTTGLAMGATYPIAGMVKSYSRKLGVASKAKAATYAKRATVDAPNFAYNKTREHFHNKREAKRQVSYTGGIVSPKKQKEVNETKKSDR